MPPYLDVYSWSPRRDRIMVDAFLAEYADVEASSDRTGEELMVLPLGFDGDDDDLPRDDWEWIAIASLEQALDIGFGQPHRAFTLYLRPVPDWSGSLLAFTQSGDIVFGLSLDDPGADPAVLAAAEEAMVILVRATGGTRGWVSLETPPPLIPGRVRPWESALASYEASSTRRQR